MKDFKGGSAAETYGFPWVLSLFGLGWRHRERVCPSGTRAPGPGSSSHSPIRARADWTAVTLWSSAPDFPFSRRAQPSLAGLARQTSGQSGLLGPAFRPGAAPLIGAAVAQQLEGNGQKSACRGHLGAVGAFGRLQALVIGLEIRIAGDRRRHRLDEGPAQPFVALLDDPAVTGLAARGIGRGHEPGI